MKEQVSLILPPEKEKDKDFVQREILLALEKKGITSSFIEENGGMNYVFSKKSIDARHGKVKFVIRYDVYIAEEPPSSQDAIPEWKSVKDRNCKTVIVVGSGPAGLFGAFKLLEGGVKPIIIERGASTKERKVDIARISTQGFLDSDSNYCFGEGGAGTFSDGKLFTRSTKRGNVGQVLRIFNHFGADSSILTDAHPHIGTDKLPYIINAMRKKITDLGGEFFFNTRCTAFIKDESSKGEKIAVKGIKTVNTKSGEKRAVKVKPYGKEYVKVLEGLTGGELLLQQTAEKKSGQNKNSSNKKQGNLPAAGNTGAAGFKR